MLWLAHGLLRRSPEAVPDPRTPPGGHNPLAVPVHAKQTLDELFERHSGAHGPPGELLVMVVKGCSGSTWMRTQAIELLAAFGVPGVMNLGEGTKAAKNPFLARGVPLGAGTAQMCAAIGAAGVPGLLKSLPSDSLDRGFLTTLQLAKAKVVLVRRSELDTTICAARDCFASGMHNLKQVSASGHVQQCASRRFGLTKELRLESRDAAGLPKERSSQERAELAGAGSQERFYVPDPHGLVQGLADDLAQQDQDDQRFAAAGLAVAKLTFERLTAYEYDPADLGQSVDEWMKLLNAYGVPDNAAARLKVEHFLAPAVGTFVQPRYKDVLVNYAEVKAAFKKAEPRIRAMFA